MKRNGMKELMIAPAIIAFTGLLMLLFSCFSEQLYPLYQQSSKAWLSFPATFFSFIGVCCWDYLFLIGIVAFLFLLFTNLFKRKSVGKLLGSAVLTISILLNMMVSGFMLNHYGPSLASQIDPAKNEYTSAQLYASAEYYFCKAQQFSKEVTVSADDFDEPALLCGSAYRSPALRYCVFSRSVKPVKKISLLGEYLLYNGIVGMFMPLSGESGVPFDDYPIALPFNMCHEAAHRLGIANEEDCNFAAFIACTDSDDARLKYSGYYMAFRYCFNTLYVADLQKALQLIEEHRNSENYNMVIEDYNSHSVYYLQYESRLEDISDSLNDAYLKAFSNEEGTLSYSKVCDDPVCFYIQRISMDD